MINLDPFWAAEERCLEVYLNQIENLDSDKISSAIAGIDAIGFSFGNESVEDILEINGSNAVITIAGVLTPNGPSPIARLFGIEGTGFNQIRAAAEQLMSNDSVETVTLKMNTPGGTVDGTDDTFMALQALAQIKKVTAENHGMIASAGYWLAIAADNIVAMTPTAETGSIGIVHASLDFSEALANEGIKVVVITSKNAPNKDMRAGTDEGRTRIFDRMNPIEDLFIGRVAEARGVSVDKVKADFGRGGVLIAQATDPDKPDAVSVGMIDSVLGKLGSKIETNKQNQTIEVKDTAMNLTEYMAAHPAGAIEVKALEDAATEKAVAGEKERQSKIVDYAKNYLANETYGAVIGQFAAGVISGENTLDSLKALITMEDRRKETEASEAAAEETKKAGDSAPEMGKDKEDAVASKDGTINSLEALDKEADRLSPGSGGK